MEIEDKQRQPLQSLKFQMMKSIYFALQKSGIVSFICIQTNIEYIDIEYIDYDKYHITKEKDSELVCVLRFRAFLQRKLHSWLQSQSIACTR